MAKAKHLIILIVFFIGFAPCAYGMESVNPDNVQFDHEIGKEPDVFIFEEPCPDQADYGDPAVSGESDGCDDETGEHKELPRIAIIIDDMGHHRQIGEDLLELDMNLTFSFLPHAPFTQEQESQAWQQGHDILVHMPMEPKDSQWDPGPGTLYLDNSDQELLVTIRQNLEMFPMQLALTTTWDQVLRLIVCTCTFSSVNSGKRGFFLWIR